MGITPFLNIYRFVVFIILFYLKFFNTFLIILQKYDFTFVIDTVILELTVYTGGFAHGIYSSPFQAMHDLISYIF